MWALVIIFTCGSGCGEPAKAGLGNFPTYEACHAEGLKWLSAAANPQHAVRAFTCASPPGRRT